MSTRGTDAQKVAKPISYIQGSFRHSSMLATFASFESCSSWLTLILLSQTPVLIPEDFNTQVVEPSTAPPNDSTLGMAACAYGVACCAPCTTPASCQAHPLQSPHVYRAPSLWHADSTSLLTDQPRPSHLPPYWPFDTTRTP